MKSVHLATTAAATLAASVAAVGCHHDPAEQVIELGPPRSLVYVTDDLTEEKHGGAAATGVVHVFDAETLAHVGEFEAGDGASEIHGTADGALVWMVATTEGTVSLLDTTTYDFVELDVGVSPVHSYESPDRSQIWVGNDGSADVSVIDVASRSVVRTVLTGAGHHKMAMVGDLAVPSFTGVYVSNIVDGSITPVSASGATRTNVAGVGAAPHGMDYSSVTARVYNCSGDAQNSLEVIATTDESATAGDETDTIVARVALPARCGYVHVSDDGLTAYATLGGSDQFARIRLSDHHLDLFDTGDKPDKFEVVGDRAYVVNVLESTVTIVDLTGLGNHGSIAVGAGVAPGATSGHRSIRFDHHTNRLFVPNAYDGTVSVVSTLTNAVVATLDGMHAPQHVAVAGPGYGTTYPR